jgi:hypothetical protein
MCHDNEKALAEKKKERKKLTFTKTRIFPSSFMTLKLILMSTPQLKYMVLRLLSGYLCIKQRCQFLSKLSGHISQKVWAICESTAPFLVFKENS